MTSRLTALFRWAFFLILLSAFTVTAQTRVEERQVFIEVQACIDDAKNSFKRDSTEDSITRDIEDTFKGLKGKWEDGVKKDLTAEYLASLQGYCPLLRDAASSQKNAKEKREILRYIKKDLSAKSEAAGRIGHAAATMAASIRVTFKTFKDDVEVPGYLVRCNPTLYGITSSAKYPFGDESSPTSRDLPPGFYVCWVADKNGTAVTKPREIPVTNGNGEEFKFSL